MYGGRGDSCLLLLSAIYINLAYLINLCAIYVPFCPVFTGYIPRIHTISVDKFPAVEQYYTNYCTLIIIEYHNISQQHKNKWKVIQLIP